MADDYKLHLNQKADVYIGKKLVSIAPRGGINLSDKDIEASPQIQELIARNALRKLPKVKEKAGTAAPRPKSVTKDDPKKKD